MHIQGEGGGRIKLANCINTSEAPCGWKVLFNNIIITQGKKFIQERKLFRILPSRITADMQRGGKPKYHFMVVDKEVPSVKFRYIMLILIYPGKFATYTCK